MASMSFMLFRSSCHLGVHVIQVLLHGFYALGHEHVKKRRRRRRTKKGKEDDDTDGEEAHRISNKKSESTSRLPGSSSADYESHDSMYDHRLSASLQSSIDAQQHMQSSQKSERTSASSR